ncbi:NAD-dependent protein deacetylase of SIR2 family [Pseudonocardia nigra]|uniref:NAD-dependent protein deacetylase of SIR2 family n=1 Tax=Pseudonocardia nigra TaxID=1921578 RepID=UPI001C5FF6C2|nr:NAD-dependent protein deacetylase of SIR2 family [Pseudonocardia nigra]
MQSGPAPREIACDESGYEGEKLVGGETDVFAHASVYLTPESAAGCVVELRRRIRSPALEYKANYLLREKHRSALVWLLGPRGPLGGAACVHLVDKAFLLVDRLVGDGAPGSDAARALYRAGREAPHRAHWHAFLAAANDVLRPRNRQDARAAGSLADTVRALRTGMPAEAGAVLLELGDPRGGGGLLDPLVPAIVRAVDRWSDGGRLAVSVVHDRQTALTQERVATIAHLAGTPGGRPVGLCFVESRTDPRVQVADFIAGVARKVASDDLAGRNDPELVALLRPYVDPASLWGDDRSWARLAPAAVDLA